MSLVVTINSVDRSSSVVFNSLRKTDNLNQQVDVLEFDIRKAGDLTYVPVPGHEIVVTRDGNTIFGGVIMRVTETVEAANMLTYHVECSDYSQYLKRQLVTERYEGMTVAEIVENLLTNYTSDGFTSDATVSTLEIDSISFNRLTVADCLQKLADAISYVWYVDYDKDVHFMARNSEPAPFGLTDTSKNYIFDSLEIIEDLTQVRNSILVQGGEATSTIPRTELLSGDGTRTIFPLATKFASLPTVTVGGVAQTVGVANLNTDEASFDCMWDFNQKSLRFTTGNEPVDGDNNIEVTGNYLFPIVVKVPALVSQAEFGTYEFAITDKSIRSQAEAIARAKAELTKYQNELYEGRFSTYEHGLRSGQILSINSAQRGKNVMVLIQSVTAKMRGPLGDIWEYQVRFATLKSIGVIEYLQNQLRSKEIIVDEQEILLNYFAFEERITASDELTVETFTPPYKWSNDGHTTPNRLIWGYGGWA
jgi:hypothetical protein